MKTVGRVFVPRSIFDDEVFGEAPYSEREGHCHVNSMTMHLL